MGDRLATIDISQKLGDFAPLFGGELGPHVTQGGLGRGLPLYQVASWSIQPFAHNRHGQKWGGAVPLLGRAEVVGAGSASNTMLPGSRPTIVPSGILIHPVVWPQQTWAKNLGLCPFLGGAGSPSSTMLLRSRPTFLPSGILIHRAIWPQQIWAKLGVCAPLGEGQLDPNLTQCGQGRGLPACQVSSWSIQPFGHNTPTLQTDRTDS